MEHDDADFIDRDYQAARQAAASGPSTAGGQRPPSREELEVRVGETHQKLAELKRAQEALERERVALEEARRRRTELHQGHAEMLQHLTRGVGLLEEAEAKARRDAEQMARTLEGFRDALAKVQSIREESWTEENWSAELTRALTILENARMEWNSARLRWSLLDGAAASGPLATRDNPPPAQPGLESLDFLPLVRIGLAFTLPVTILAAIAFVVWLFYLLG